MLCDKCGTPHMVEDSTSNIEVYRCWVCGNRMYANHPKRDGAQACRKCGGTVEEANILNYCRSCWAGLQVFKKRTPLGPDVPFHASRKSPKGDGRRPGREGKKA
jgi:hypothetical protein